MVGGEKGTSTETTEGWEAHCASGVSESSVRVTSPSAWRECGG